MNKLQKALNEDNYIKAKRLIIDNPEYLEENVDLVLGKIESIKKLNDLYVPGWSPPKYYVQKDDIPSEEKEELLKRMRNESGGAIDRIVKSQGVQWGKSSVTQSELLESISKKVKIGDENDKVDMDGVNINQLEAPPKEGFYHYKVIGVKEEKLECKTNQHFRKADLDYIRKQFGETNTKLDNSIKKAMARKDTELYSKWIAGNIGISQEVSGFRKDGKAIITHVAFTNDNSNGEVITPHENELVNPLFDDLRRELELYYISLKSVSKLYDVDEPCSRKFKIQLDVTNFPEKVLTDIFKKVFGKNITLDIKEQLDVGLFVIVTIKEIPIK